MTTASYLTPVIFGDVIIFLCVRAPNVMFVNDVNLCEALRM